MNTYRRKATHTLLTVREHCKTLECSLHFTIDGDMSRHVLKLEDYGGNNENAWVLLEEAEPATQQ